MLSDMFMMGINHFTKSEFNCPCCGQNDMQEITVQFIDDVRDIYGQPISITSGYRCEEHNKSVGGHNHSAHLSGYAIDIKCDNSLQRAQLLSIIFKLISEKNYIVRLGIAKTFIHLDFANQLPNPRIWLYT